MYEVKWILHQRIVLLQAVGDQTIEDIEEGIKQLNDFFTGGQPPVHVISDSRYMGKFPVSLKLLNQQMKPHENSGYTVAIGGNALTNFISKMLSRAAKGPDMIFSDSIESALAQLQHLDATLPQQIDYIDQPPR